MLIHFKAQWFQQFPNVEIFCLRKVRSFAFKYFKINQTRVLAINIFFFVLGVNVILMCIFSYLKSVS